MLEHIRMGKDTVKELFNWSVDGDNDSSDSRKEYTGKYKIEGMINL